MAASASLFTVAAMWGGPGAGPMPPPVLASDAAVVLVADGPRAADTSTVHTALAALTVAAETNDEFARDLFAYGIDADADGCDTRREVLIGEATAPPTVSAGCAISGGGWHSYYDGLAHADAARLEVDHLVPLAEAWGSGAFRWTPGMREAYANDLDDARTLVAVSTAVNQDKGGQDVARWLPPSAGAHCRYLQEWVAVKTRWGLSVDEAERDALWRLAAACTDNPLTVVVAGTGPAGTTSQPAVFHFDGYGPLLVGMTEEEALAASPVQLVAYLTVGGTSGQDQCTFYADKATVDSGGDLARGLQVTVKNGRVVTIDQFVAAASRTNRGIRAGSSRDEVVAAYPERHHEGDSIGGPVILVAGPNGHDLGFALDDGGTTVDGIGVGIQGYSPGIELCSGPSSPPFDTGRGERPPGE